MHRLEQPGWCESKFDDSKWENAVSGKPLREL